MTSPRGSSWSPSLLIGFRMKKYLPIFDFWLNLVAICLDDENELPLKAITVFSS